MIEKVLYDYLNEHLDVPAVLEKPAPLPRDFVFIERTGGNVVNHIENATITIQSYGSTLYDAASLNERVKTLMLNSVTLTEISSCTLNSNYNFTDASEKRHRYQAVFDVVFVNKED